MQKRVAITGIGPVAPCAAGREALWRALFESVGPAGTITRFDATPYRTRIAYELCYEEVLRHLPLAREWAAMRKLRVFGEHARSLRYAAAAADLAVTDARLDVAAIDRERAGAVIGGDVGDCGMTHHSRPTPAYVLLGAVRSAAGLIAYELGLHGPCRGISAACSTGNVCLQDGVREIQADNADVMIVGSTDAPLVAPRPFADFDALGAMSRHNESPQDAFRPFDRDRDGFVISEGAGAIVLEELEHARSRGARIYAEVLGVSDYTFPDSTFARVDEEGYSRSLAIALQRAGLAADDLRGATVYINAHGTATVNNDIEETKALRRVFGTAAQDLLVSSTKPVTGHQQTACSSNELIICALALSEGAVPPTFNLQSPDPECDLNFLSDGPVSKPVDIAISNTSGFCGIYSAAVLGQVR